MELCRHAGSTTIDYYEVLQASPTAEPEIIHRIYRLLAQRFHPDNQETGDPTAFASSWTYMTLSISKSARNTRVASSAETGSLASDFDRPQGGRGLRVRTDHPPHRARGASCSGGVWNQEAPGWTPAVEQLIGRPRSTLSSRSGIWQQKKLVYRDDSARLMITARG